MDRPFPADSDYQRRLVSILRHDTPRDGEKGQMRYHPVVGKDSVTVDLLNPKHSPPHLKRVQQGRLEDPVAFLKTGRRKIVEGHIE